MSGGWFNRGGNPGRGQCYSRLLRDFPPPRSAAIAVRHPARRPSRRPARHGRPPAGRRLGRSWGYGWDLPARRRRAAVRSDRYRVLGCDVSALAAALGEQPCTTHCGPAGGCRPPPGPAPGRIAVIHGDTPPRRNTHLCHHLPPKTVVTIMVATARSQPSGLRHWASPSDFNAPYPRRGGTHTSPAAVAGHPAPPSPTRTACDRRRRNHWGRRHGPGIPRSAGSAGTRSADGRPRWRPPRAPCSAAANGGGHDHPGRGRPAGRRLPRSPTIRPAVRPIGLPNRNP